jgi:hypothetical protein
VNRKITLPNEALPARLTLNPELRMNDDDYFAFCMANPDVWLERTVEGEIVIVPPVGAPCTIFRIGTRSPDHAVNGNPGKPCDDQFACIF